MEDLSKRVPLINRFIIINLDEKSVDNFKKSSRDINKVLNNERVYWKKILSRYGRNFEEFQESWNEVIFKTSCQNLKQLQ